MSDQEMTAKKDEHIKPCKTRGAAKEIVMLPVSEVRPYEKNPRKNAEAVKYVKASIEKFGFKQPIIVDSNRVIIAGHTRLEAAKSLGMAEVPCIVADDLTDAQVKALRLADNKVAEFSEWEMNLLGEELGELAEISDIDMGDFGFDLSEFDNIGMDEKTEVEEDEVPEEVEPVCQRGEIWQLGEHRLMCGDSTSAEDVSRLMEGSKANLLFTDPPYGVSYEKKTKEVLKSKNYTKIQNDDLKLDQFKDFLFDVFTNARASLLDSASYYVFSCQGGDQEMMMMMMMRECGIPCLHQIIWVKDAPVFSMGRLDYDYKHEPILYGWVKKHDFQRKGEQDKSVWEFKRTENKLHPTMKPVPLIANALLNSTKGEEVVLDLFGGSGSTLIACEQLNRKCRMMELDPHYCDVIIARWEKLTGKKAVKL
jgi:site-specific DNA-methyltransferase (adenine-specific)